MRVLFLVLLSISLQSCAGHRINMVDCPITGQDPETHETYHSCKRALS